MAYELRPAASVFTVVARDSGPPLRGVSSTFGCSVEPARASGRRARAGVAWSSRAASLRKGVAAGIPRRGAPKRRRTGVAV